MAESKVRVNGFKCPVRGCIWSARRFSSPMATARHIQDKHGLEELMKRLRLAGESSRRLQHQAGTPGGRVKRPTPPPKPSSDIAA